MMRARRVTIMLFIVAISALTLFLITLLEAKAGTVPPGPGSALAAVPDTLLCYEETIVIGPDGNSVVEITVVIGKGGPGDLLLPFNFDSGTDFTLLSGPASFRPGPQGRPAPLVRVLGRNMLNLVATDGATVGDTVRVSAALPDWYRMEESRKPFGEFALKTGFVNFSSYVMRECRRVMVLPPGMVVHSVTRAVPEYDAKKNPRPPFEFAERDGLVRAAVFTDNLAPAGVIGLDLNIRPGRRGPIPLVLGILAALLYLIFYRDVLKPKETE